jgi:dihydropteroate synthase
LPTQSRIESELLLSCWKNLVRPQQEIERLSTHRQIHFVTGKLAEPLLREMLEPLASRFGFGFSIQVLPITVAALMTPSWIAARIHVPEGTDEVMLPGLCQGDLTPLTSAVSVPVTIGPKDLLDLPLHFGGQRAEPDLSQFDIEIIAEINHAPRLSLDQLSALARQLAEAGADVIDLGCNPGETWSQVGTAVRMLRDAGLRVSIDSFNIPEIAAATRAGAELVLSVNSSNYRAAADWGARVVVVPDEPQHWQTMESVLAWLDQQRVPFCLDPILEPIGVGFWNSLSRYGQARQRWPDAEMMMGIGNLTELTDVDSAGVNFLLLGICQELRIQRVLTTQVINWARTSVAECNWARRIVKHAVDRQTPPKRVSLALVMLRDPRLASYSSTQLAAMAEEIIDHNVRLFACDQQVAALAERGMWVDSDPFVVFDELRKRLGPKMDPDHAFYLGYEMAKLEIANQLGKQYVQDEALSWGHMTRNEKKRHRLKRRRSME